MCSDMPSTLPVGTLLAIDVDFNDPNLRTKTVVDANGQTTTAVYVPVILK